MFRAFLFISICFLVVLNYGVCNGGEVSDMKVKIDCENMTLKIADKVQLVVEPLTIVSVENEQVMIGDEKPKSWASKTKLRQVIGKGTTLPGCLVPNSIIVKSADATTVYERDKDYIVDDTWAALARLPEGKINKGDKVLVSYKYSLQRLDLLQKSEKEVFSIKKGKEAKSSPIPPEPDKDNKAIANIFLSYHTTKLNDELIYPIGSSYPEPTKDEIEANSKLVQKTLNKLRNGEKLTIVCWGDSVTAGGDTSTPDKRFANLFINTLKNRFPKAEINFVNAGIGGSNTNQRLPKIQEEVLKYNPDLVTIEFVNDMGIGDLKNNYFSAIDQLREKGSEIIIITPHFTNPGMMGLKSIKDAKDTRRGVQQLREIAKEKGVGLADASKRWEHLAKEGVPYTTLLFNEINHPDDRGHKIFVDELIKFFPEK